MRIARVSDYVPRSMKFEHDTCRECRNPEHDTCRECRNCVASSMVLLEWSRVLRICPPRFVDLVSAVVAPPLSLCRSPPSPPTVSRPLLRVSRVLPLTRRLSVGLIVHDTINSMGIPLSTCRASAGPGSQPAAGAKAPAPTAHNYESKPEGSDSTAYSTITPRIYAPTKSSLLPLETAVEITYLHICD